MTAWLSTGPSFYILVLPIMVFAEKPYIKARPNKDIDNTCMFPRCGVKPPLALRAVNIPLTG